jgi:ribonuclease HI
MIYVYTDGGIMIQSPSDYGGAWAYVIVYGGTPGVHPCQGRVLSSGSGLFLKQGAEMPAEVEGFCEDSGLDRIENNLTEYYAAYRGLAAAFERNYLTVTLCSDNQNALKRLTAGWATNGCPEWLVEEANLLVSRFIRVDTLLLGGHPIAKTNDLERGHRKDGKTVSVHNVWCDKECTRLQKLYLANRTMIQTQNANG